MGPKVDPTAVKIVYVRAVGGEGAGTTLAQKLGPFGVNPKKAQEDISKATIAYKGLKVGVKLTIVNRQATIEVIPSTSCLVLKALDEPPRDRKKQKNIKHNGTVTLDSVVEIARSIRNKSMAKMLKGTVCEVAGTCHAIGCKIDGKSPRDFIAEVKAGEVEIPEQ
eukprot:GHVP01050154.1.p1 GENE.GHVP01050154.1~~GHVP01050154.1.p1  ORF type:complete len:176 (-),score=34.32 GHVP01050154.1:166-660(-)